MKLEELELLWCEDSIINDKDLATESLKIPKLHQKWYGIYIQEKLLLQKIKIKIEELEILLDGYYSKTLTPEELNTLGIPYTDKKVLKPDIPRAINTHSKMVDLKLKHYLQTEKCDYIKDIIKMIHNRSFIIKDAISWKQFAAGG